MAGSPLARLREVGQSVWCDDISRKLLKTGALESLITEDGISGLTSNPTIFHKAIAGGAEYDDGIRELSSRGYGAEEIAEALAVEDIVLAADQLQAVHSDTKGRDGWVSIEIAPKWAYDYEQTVAQAMRVRAMVDRPNVMVKVPATEEGVAAFQELTSRGYSVNVTLIFSLERYSQVMEAYLAGLERLRTKLEEGESGAGLGEVHSVASFFVSRVDTAVDNLLEAQGADLRELKGRAAVANARLAYRLFRETFAGPRWETLKAAGAVAQRPLWASTSTKDPAYSDIMYVQELIGEDTVTTLPLETLDLFRDHGRVEETISLDLQGAQAHLDRLDASGVDLGAVTERLEQDGVKSFAKSYDALVEAVGQKGVS